MEKKVKYIVLSNSHLGGGEGEVKKQENYMLSSVEKKITSITFYNQFIDRFQVSCKP